MDHNGAFDFWFDAGIPMTSPGYQALCERVAATEFCVDGRRVSNWKVGC